MGGEERAEPSVHSGEPCVAGPVYAPQDAVEVSAAADVAVGIAAGRTTSGVGAYM